MTDFSLLDARLQALDQVLASERAEAARHPASTPTPGPPATRAAKKHALDASILSDSPPLSVAPPARLVTSGRVALPAGGYGKMRGICGKGSRRTSVQQNKNTQAQRKYRERRREQEEAMVCQVDTLTAQLQESEAVGRARDADILRLTEENRALVEDVDGLRQDLKQAQAQAQAQWKALPQGRASVGAAWMLGQASGASECGADTLSVNILLQKPATPFKTAHLPQQPSSYVGACPVGARTVTTGGQERACLKSEELMQPETGLDDFLNGLLAEQPAAPGSSGLDSLCTPYGSLADSHVDKLVQELDLDFMEA